MEEVALDFDLSSQLVLHIVLEELALVEDFKRDDELGFLFSRKIHVAKLASSERLSNFEVIYTPISALECLHLNR